MWYLKQAARKATQAAGSVYSYSKSLVVGESVPTDPVYELLLDLLEQQSEILPTKKLDELVNYSYNIDSFQKISDWLVKKLSIFKYEESRIKECVNMLTIIYYLIKHGASGFVDDFRAVIKMFQNYQKLVKKTLSDDQKQQMEIDNQIDIIVSKARHIEILLTDKGKLLKEKQLAMLIKQKVATYSQNKNKSYNTNFEKQKKQEESILKSTQKQLIKLSQKKIDESQKSTKCQQQNNVKTKDQQKNQNRLEKSPTKKTKSTVNDLLEAYVWKYIDSLDDKIQNITDKVINKFDYYVDRIIQGDKPEEFQLGDSDDEKDHDQVHSSVNKTGDQLMDKINKEIEGLEIKQQDLLEFGQTTKQEIEHKPTPKLKPKEDPIVIELL